MLVITRYAEQGIRIGEAKVKILGVEPCGRVRLGIDAPRDIPIIREEIVGTDRDVPRDRTSYEPRSGFGWGPQS